MLKMINYLRELLVRNKKIRDAFIKFTPSKFKYRVGLYPVSLGREKERLIEVLNSGNWNMSYGRHPAHIDLERDFAKYIGCAEAVAVSGGGVGIQMALRALGLGRKSEVLMQIDTCSAVPMATLNAQTIPRFFDADPDTFLSNIESVKLKYSKNSHALIASHLWGNPENVTELKSFCDSRNLMLIEDCCLALGTEIESRKVGTFGKIGIFSFGSTKPIQAGEGGILVTDDANLAKELRAMRNWGERTKDFGTRDVNELSWNGRISEFSAAVAREQLLHYPKIISQVQDHVAIFNDYLENNRNDMTLNLGAAKSIHQSTFTQVVVRLIGHNQKTKHNLLKELNDNGIIAFHANFEPVSTLTLFESGDWTKWISTPEWDTEEDLADRHYENAFEIYNTTGLGFSRSNFQSRYTLNRLISVLEKIRD